MHEVDGEDSYVRDMIWFLAFMGGARRGAQKAKDKEGRSTSSS